MKFKYKVGEYLIGAIDEGKEYRIVFQVTERVAQECPGGTQYWYTVRGWTKEDFRPGAVPHTTLIKMLEIELAPRPKEKTKKEIEAKKDKESRKMLREIQRRNVAKAKRRSK